jgi:hypothetical protein
MLPLQAGTTSPTMPGAAAAAERPEAAGTGGAGGGAEAALQAAAGQVRAAQEEAREGEAQWQLWYYVSDTRGTDGAGQQVQAWAGSCTMEALHARALHGCCLVGARLALYVQWLLTHNYLATGGMH